MAIIETSVMKKTNTIKLDQSDLDRIVKMFWDYKEINVRKGIGKSLTNKIKLLQDLV